MKSPPAEPKRGESRRRLRSAERRTQLVDVAEELFIERGYAAVAMEDIAKTAGVSRPIVYRHFDNKEGAYLACVRRARKMYHKRVADTVDLSDPPRRQVERGAEVFYEILEEDPGRWRLLFGSNSVLPGEISDGLAEMRRETISRIHWQLKTVAPNAPELETEAAAHAISGLAERLGHWWLTRPDLTRQDMVRLHVDFVWGALGKYVE